MAEDEAIESLKVTETLGSGFTLENTTPDDAWISRPVPESISEAMERAPLGALYEIVYAALAKRMRALLDPDSQLDGILTKTLVHTAVNFRSLNPGFLANRGFVPTVPPNSGAGAGDYHSSIWGANKDERLPNTAPNQTQAHEWAAGQDPLNQQNKGLLIAKLFTDLEHHLPVVLFNITNKEYQPIGIGGSSVSKRFYKDGYVVSEIAYRAMLSVEATVATEDDESTSNLQAIVEACFGPLRDQIESGSALTGRSWQLTLPTNLTPSPITELEAPWSQGDDKGAKLYTATVGLESMSFECFTYVGRPVTALMSQDPAGQNATPGISLASGDDDPEGPLQLVLGRRQRLVVSGASVTSQLAVDQNKRVITIRQPWEGSGVYEVVPRRTGEATILLYDTQMTQPAMTSDLPAVRVGEPVVKRKVVVSAC